MEILSVITTFIVVIFALQILSIDEIPLLVFVFLVPLMTIIVFVIRPWGIFYRNRIGISAGIRQSTKSRRMLSQFTASEETIQAHKPLVNQIYNQLVSNGLVLLTGSQDAANSFAIKVARKAIANDFSSIFWNFKDGVFPPFIVEEILSQKLRAIVVLENVHFATSEIKVLLSQVRKSGSLVIGLAPSRILEFYPGFYDISSLFIEIPISRLKSKDNLDMNLRKLNVGVEEIRRNAHYASKIDEERVDYLITDYYRNDNQYSNLIVRKFLQESNRNFTSFLEGSTNFSPVSVTTTSELDRTRRAVLGIIGVFSLIDFPISKKYVTNLLRKSEKATSLSIDTEFNALFEDGSIRIEDGKALLSNRTIASTVISVCYPVLRELLTTDSPPYDFVNKLYIDYLIDETTESEIFFNKLVYFLIESNNEILARKLRDAFSLKTPAGV